MSRTKREWHPDFIKYMEMIVNHPNYKGLEITKKKDGSYRWLAPKDSVEGQKRIEWCERKAKELDIEQAPGFYAKVMLQIHPTKWKTCQTCGRVMSLYYHYPNYHFVNAINKKFNSSFTSCDHISDIWEKLISHGVSPKEISAFLIDKGGLSLDAKTASKEEIIGELEYICREGNKNLLGPGAMSNFPDRFDGFHSYNRCCRSKQDKGRSKENMKTYTNDRRAYEYWSDGNIYAANKFMGSKFFKGTTADHIGPISLGFVHDPRYLQPMPGGDNSSKRDRLQFEDIEKILVVEKRTGVYPMSWYSKEIWEYIKKNYKNNREKVAGPYRDALKQNMSNFMFVLYTILENCGEKGKEFLTSAFLSPKYKYFDYNYTFNKLGEYKTTPRHRTARSNGEFDRYKRIAIQSVYDYNDKANRNINNNLSKDEKMLLNSLCFKIGELNSYNVFKEAVEYLMYHVQHRLIKNL